jgi:hypothetical protein
MMQDASHLRMLAIGYYVYGGLTAFFSFFALIYVGFGAAMLSGKFPPSPRGATPPHAGPIPDQMVGGFMLGFGIIFFLIIIAMAVLSFMSARWISARKHPVFCLVIGGLACLNMPLGTIVGVFTFIVLLRPSVQELFRAGPERNNFVNH